MYQHSGYTGLNLVNMLKVYINMELVGWVKVFVETNKPVVDYLWSEAKLIIRMVNAAMLLSLRIFVIKVDHGLSNL